LPFRAKIIIIIYMVASVPAGHPRRPARRALGDVYSALCVAAALACLVGGLLLTAATILVGVGLHWALVRRAR